MNLEERLDAIRFGPLRRLAKAFYYAMTFQFFSRLQARREYYAARRLKVPLLEKVLPADRIRLEITPVRSRAEYELQLAQPAWRARASVDRRLAEEHRGEEAFRVPGFSLLAGHEVDFLVDRQGADFPADMTIPNWREHLVCPVTQLTNRQRAMVLLLRTYGGKDCNVFMFEQVTPLYRYLRAAAPAWKITGCEWLGPDVKPGAVVDGIRHEDHTALSLTDSSVDIVMSLDVFEHVPDPRRGFIEIVRVLRSSGLLLLTVPFFPDRDETGQRARFENGRIEHLLPPEYHGNPVDPDGGSLVYHDFGWDLLPMMRECGFGDAWAGLYWSREYGHLGAPQIVFIATK